MVPILVLSAVVLPNAPFRDREAVTLPACRALSVLYYGSYAGADEAFLRLGREVKERGLTPAGDRVCWALLRPTPGAKSKPNGIAPAWCCRWRAKPNRLFPCNKK